MKEFFEKNKTFLAIVVGAAVIGAAIYFGNNQKPQSTQNLNGPVQSETIEGNKLVTKIIDGDTVIVEGGLSVRLLGIDADEKGYPCFQSAAERLEELVLNKEVRLEKDAEDKDQYQRFLRYLISDNKNINLELVKEGLAVARFSPENQKYKLEITEAENQAVTNKIGCKWGGEKTGEQKTVFQWEKLTPELTGLKVTVACEAKNYQNQEMIVEGKVAAAYRSKTNTIFFNFVKPYPNQCFTAVIFSSSQNKFVDSPEKYYSDKTVRVRGKIKEYQGKPEIILESPSQIEMGK